MATSNKSRVADTPGIHYPLYPTNRVIASLRSALPLIVGLYTSGVSDTAAHAVCSALRYLGYFTVCSCCPAAYLHDCLSSAPHMACSAHFRHLPQSAVPTTPRIDRSVRPPDGLLCASEMRHVRNPTISGYAAYRGVLRPRHK